METLIALLTTLVLAIVPMLLYALFLWWMDRYEKEPLSLILASFLWGAVPAVIFSLIAQLILDVPVSDLFGPGLETELVSASLIAPITEEPFKGLMLLFLLWFFRREIDTPVDGILYGGLVGFGFATTENLFYFLNAYHMGGLGNVLILAFFRAVLFGLNHALFTGCIGLGIALALTSSRRSVRITAPFIGLGMAIMLHGLHNLGATLASVACWALLISLASDWGSVLAWLALLIYFSVREQRILGLYLTDEVEKGTITPEDYAVICSYWRRVEQRLKALAEGDIRRWRRLGTYYRLASELAFARHHLVTVGHDEGTARRVQQLRRDLQRLQEVSAPPSGRPAR
ncbi:MAG: PrsW family intramembrane metalloprotease [Anaerolineae bacterium]|nr:PrsW family intramembrane metalloprotease [Anaerolineae bacterium]MDW8068209.1 PrsW family intramembrane metalloprotease [Anaerolineae bacterium]